MTRTAARRIVAGMTLSTFDELRADEPIVTLAGDDTRLSTADHRVWWCVGFDGKTELYALGSECPSDEQKEAACIVRGLLKAGDVATQ